MEPFQIHMRFDLDTVNALVSQIKWLRLVSDMIIQCCVQELFDRTMSLRGAQLKDISVSSTPSEIL
jgi:hypothetical protein